MSTACSNDTKNIDRIIVGLGNPGEKYRWNRHNTGFMTLDALAEQTSGIWSTSRFSQICRIELGGRPVLLAKSLTYMNHSGESIYTLVTALKRSTEDLLLVYDDLDLPLGRIRIRQRGSAGGHKGVQSVLTIFKTEEIMRLRMGIGEEHAPDDPIDFVLSDFPPGKRPELDRMILKAGDAVKSILSEGVSKSMTIFNA